ncbi:MAG: ATP-binding cassette domain-containing protein [Lachnospiraceae bacterium]|nr:ATP-binding cassette domain-containing protein [Lachnospiraceae bacterium]
MIRFEDASFHYGGENGTGEGVDHINLTICDGEVVVLCGASGCGKTTITRMINGLAPKYYKGMMEGAVWVNDICVTESELSETSRLVGSVFQNPKSQFFNIDTTGELAFGCENQGVPGEMIGERLKKTETEMRLGPLMGRNIFELSGGEKQQIACGSVYTTDPMVYVLDEPSSNLDRKAIQRLHDILMKIKKEGKTIVISEHRLYYLMDLADRFIYLEDGIIQKSYSNKEIAELTDRDLAEKGLRLTDLSELKREYDKNEKLLREPILEAVDLNCAKGGNQILDIARLILPKNSVTAIIGDNGSGKSTLSEALCGIGSCDGSIAYDGVYLSAKERAERSFMVMQDVNRQLFSDSVIEEVMMNTSVTREKAEQILEKLGLKEVIDRHPASLSGGQKQRVAIASALSAGKEIIFYDEPTSGLDRGGMERFGNLLKDMGEEITSVIITHDPELILRCCTHILHIENGRIQAFYPLNEDGVTRIRSYFTSENDENTSKTRKKYGVMGRVLKYTGKWKKYVFAALVFMIAGALCGIVPYLGIYDLLCKIVGGGTVTLENSMVDIGIVLGFGILNAVFYTIGLQFSHRAAYHTLENIRISLQEKLDNQPIGTIHDLGIGSIKKLFNDDIESVEVMLAHVIPEGLSDILVGGAVFLALIAVDWQMGLFSIIILLFGIGASRQMYEVGMDRMGSYFASAKRLNNTIIEYVSGMEVVRIFNRDAGSEERFEKSVYDYRDFGLAWYKVCWPWMALYGGLFANIILYSLPLGAFLVLMGHLTMTRYILALCLSFALSPVLISALALIGTLPRVDYKIQSVEKALDRPLLKCGNEPFDVHEHSIEFENVRFAYKGDEALKGISFKAKEGEMTALIGASGSGKSTIARLIAHYYDHDSGVIRIGGHDIRQISLSDLEKEVAYVSQELFLFNKSILENIRIGRQDASDEEVKAAAIKAGCDEFIRELDGGYDTIVGTAGNKLSGGQKQRIAFARVLLKDAPIIVLDEVTAFIDPENEKKMNDAIQEIIRDKTVIVIAHKLSSIAKADKIIVLDKGSIVGTGKHKDLMKHCEMYRTLWNAATESRNWTLRRQQYK